MWKILRKKINVQIRVTLQAFSQAIAVGYMQFTEAFVCSVIIGIKWQI